MNKMQMNQKDDDDSGDKNRKNDKNGKHDQDNNINDEAEGWHTFKTILSNNDEEDHDVLFDQTKKFTNSKLMHNKFLLDTGSTIRATVYE